MVSLGTEDREMEVRDRTFWWDIGDGGREKGRMPRGRMVHDITTEKRVSDFDLSKKA